MDKAFKINNRIDLGTDGTFKPGSEARLKVALKSRKDGEKLFTRLIQRGAISLLNDEPAVETEKAEADKAKTTKQPKKAGKKTKAKAEDETDADGAADAGEGDDDVDAGEGDSEVESEGPQHEPTGQYELNGYGGGMFELIDPDGFVVDNIRGQANAEAKRDELNEKL